MQRSRHAAMFDKILIANRGEIALRVLRACKELGIPTVAVHSTADADAMHVRLADESVCIGPPPAKDSYLNIPALLAACEITGADAVHPGYGFLSENARFAEILAEHSIAFHRPEGRAHPPDGRQDRGQAHREAARHPGGAGLRRRRRRPTTTRSRSRATIGFPVLVKAAAGGGGRGMKVAHTEDELATALATARAEAKAAFGDDAVYLEKYLQRPRHIEIQVLGDGQGDAIHLGERDCSLQRRHQKVLGGKPLARAQRRRARRDRRDRRQGDARAEISRRRHGRVPVRGRRVLFHRDEHPHPGRASGDRDDHRHRPRARADPRRRRRRAAARRRRTSSSAAMPSNAASMPRIPSTFRPSPGKITALSSARRARRAGRFGGLSGLHDPAVLRLAGRQADRARQDPHRMPDAAQARARRIRGRRHRDHAAAVPRLVRTQDIIDGNYHIHWLERFLAEGGMDR